MRVAITVTFLGALCGWAEAQPPTFDPSQFDVPDQFYTNGRMIDTWNRDAANQQMVTIWFGKNPKNSVFYRQLVAVRKDNQPDLIYYFDSVGRRYVGRYDMRSEGYSLLDREHRLEKFEEIKEEWFPPPGNKPTIGELFDPPESGAPNNDQLMMPPATTEFPRLRQSSWEGFYTILNTHKRTKMKLTLDGNQGTYQQTEGGFKGRLMDVQYMQPNGENMLIMRGKWGGAHGPTRGTFEFRIMMMNLNEFQGEYWAFSSNRIYLWDAKRTSR